MSNPFVVDFSKSIAIPGKGGVCLDTHSALHNMDNQFHEFKIKVKAGNNLPKCPITSIVNDFWAPDWKDYTHSYNYNYSITINADPKASYLKIPVSSMNRDTYKQILLKRLKQSLHLIIDKKLCKNILCVIEYGVAASQFDNHIHYQKPHFHLLVQCTRINKLRELFEKVFETELKDYKICKGRFTRGPINRIRPKNRNPMYDKRTDADKVQEVKDSIDYIVYKYYQKEIKTIGNNLLFNYLTNP